MKIGYSFWGYLGDLKFGLDGKLASTPDGNAIYSWSIMQEIMRDGGEVIQVMPDRDQVGYDVLGEFLFNAWATEKRVRVYNKTKKALPAIGCDYSLATKQDIFKAWNEAGLREVDLVLHEWRMEIPGRNDEGSRWDLGASWQPDYFFQQCIIEYCRINNLKLAIFDLDYKLVYADILEMRKQQDVTILELGRKWMGIEDEEGKEFAKHVYIPFDFDVIDELSICGNPPDGLVYVGNRYERDWCIDKYIPTDMPNTAVYGNWLEAGRDSADKWSEIDFRKRLQTAEMHRVYSNATATILLAKQDYCYYGFMTARVIESVFYGTVPLFIKEYGPGLINQFTGDELLAEILTVEDKEDVIDRVCFFVLHPDARMAVIDYLRQYYSTFMDVKFFVDELYKVVVGR